VSRPKIGLHKNIKIMDKKSKLISGLKSQKRGNILKFSEAEKHLIIQEYLKSGLTKGFIWEKYTGRNQGQFQITRWMRMYGYNESYNFARNNNCMKEKEKDPDSFEILQLKKRIEELEKKLRDSEMKAIAYSTMVDIAEKEFNIPIRKKLNTKPSK